MTIHIKRETCGGVTQVCLYSLDMSANANTERWGEYLTSFCGDADAYGLGLQILLTVIADRFFVSINQDGKDPVYVDAFPETLKKHRIAYTQEDVEPNELPVMRSIRRSPDKLVGRDDRLYVSLSTAKPGKAAVSTEYES